NTFAKLKYKSSQNGKTLCSYWTWLNNGACTPGFGTRQKRRWLYQYNYNRRTVPPDFSGCKIGCYGRCGHCHFARRECTILECSVASFLSKAFWCVYDLYTLAERSGA